MREEYEQMEFDTRSDLKRGMAGLTGETISMVQTMINNCGEAPAAVRNRHEAYGIAAEHLASITAIVKSIKNDCGTLLGTLADPNYPAVEATSSIVNSTTEAAAVMLIAAAEMKRTLDNLYMAESQGTERTPLEELSDGAFEDAEPADADEEN